ncbi:MAG TPA: cobalamin-independent methionine synthase II family protein [Solirubrobacteraceae bacterium]|nr:cobalamin-independent methionine synthase II family protein [Solirubrobacteraceae bacterium]
MATQIQTSHAGSLPRPEHLIELNAARASGDGSDDAAYEQELRAAVAAVVARQRDAGITVVNDGEFGHGMGQRYDYGPWWTYVFQRLDGLELVEIGVREAVQTPAAPGAEITLASFADRRDWNLFADAYSDPGAGVALPETDFLRRAPVCRGPITYTGQEALARDIADMKAALAGAGLSDGFLNSVAPASCSRFANEHYATDEELLYACADAMREEYVAIVESGLMLQLDDPAIAENWDQIVPEPSVEAYQRFTRTRVEALNHAIRGLPPERIRFHLCWGSWHGPHVTDIPMADIVEVMLEVNAGAYSFEAANARHEHEWKIWEDVKLPEGKVIVPGIVTHSTNVIEHPELVAQRIERFASVVGAERVIASTDCGLGGRVHPQIAWAKLEALGQGAALASKRLGA